MGVNSFIVSMVIDITNFTNILISYFMIIVDTSFIDYTLNFIINIKMKNIIKLTILLIKMIFNFITFEENLFSNNFESIFIFFIK